MRRSLSWLAGMLLLAAAGFAVASITRGSSSAGAQTATVTTIAQPQTVTVTTTVTVRRTARVTICHRTGKRRPFAKTITVPATTLFAHFRHGDLPGRCTAAKIRQMKKRR